MSAHPALPAALAAALLAACTGGAPATSTTSAPATSTTTTPATSTTSTAPEEAAAFAVFFLHDSGGNDARVPPFLVAVHRETTSPDLPAAAVEALLAGPTAAEEADGISVDIPAGTTLNGVAVEDGTATVDLSRDFEAGGGSFAMLSRLASLTYTLTGLEGIDEVVLELDGEPVEVFSSEGIVLDGPLTRDDYTDLLPGILVESPAWGATVDRSFTVRGTAAAFEGVFQLEILSADGEKIAGPPYVQTDEGMGWGSFEERIELPEDAPADLVIHVWEASARDGSPVSERRIPIRVAP